MVFAQWTQRGTMFGGPRPGHHRRAGPVPRRRPGTREVHGHGPGREHVQARNPRSRQEVTLAVGEQKTGVDLVMPNGGKRIAGKVVTAEGQPSAEPS